jgi:hypothetical protein
VTLLAPAPSSAVETPVRTARSRRYLMCRPEHFEVSYAINPWMDPLQGVDRDLAVAQWETLRRTYLDLGHEVELIDSLPGLPDMVFAANGGLVIDGPALGRASRTPSAPPRVRRTCSGWPPTSQASRAPRRPRRERGRGRRPRRRRPRARRARLPHRPPRARRGAGAVRPAVVGLVLVDPRYYHLDTALAVLDDSTVAYYPARSARAAARSCAGCSRRGARERRGRRGARPQRRLRRSPRRAVGAGPRARRRPAAARLRADRRRPV